MSNLPKFKYHPDPIGTGTFIVGETVSCDCCNKEVDVYYERPFYSVEEIIAICPFCIANGEAAKKFDGEFQDSYSIEGILPDPDIPTTFNNEDAIVEVTTKTPGYRGIQQEVWLNHCDDLCAFIGYVVWDDIKSKLNDLACLESDIEKFGMNISDLETHLIKDGHMQGYLFQCLHCKKFRLHMDFD